MKLRRIWIAVSILAFSIACAAQSSSKQLATVNGQAVTEDQVTKAAARDLENLELQRMQFMAGYERDKHEIMERALNTIVEDKLLELEAAKRGVTKDALIRTEVDNKTSMPTDEEARAFYEANKSRINIPGDPIPQIRQYLRQQRRAEIRDALVAKLKTEHSVSSFLEPLRVNVASEGFPSRGPANAPVTIVEFSDFECPYCASLFPTLKEIEVKYAGRIRLVYRHFPLHQIHPNAQKAAEASMCANDQQKFWELHDAIFVNIRNISTSALKAKAAELQMDSAAFNTCLDSGKYAAAVEKDHNDGVRAGVNGTPALFINGRMLTGAQPYAEIARVIDDELARVAAKK